MPEIWIVERENATARALAECLGEEGHRTRLLASATEASALLQRGAPDLLIVSPPRPEADDADAARALLAEVAAPAVVLTAEAAPDVVERWREAGALAVFPKPFRIDHVLRCVRQALVASTGPEKPGARREPR